MGSVSLSVVIPAYNASKYIAECLTSVLSQEEAPPFEVIVVDDGSSDATAEIVARDFPSIRLIRKPNGGPGSARNRGVAEARGEIIVFIDADDVMLPGRLAFQGGFMLSNPQYGMTVGARQWQDRPNFDEFRAEGICETDNFSDIKNAYAMLMSHKHFVGGTSCAIRKDAYQIMGGQPEDIRVAEDFEMSCKLARFSRMAVSCRPLTWARRGHGDNLMASHHTYEGPVIAMRRELLANGDLLSATEYAIARTIWSKRADMLLRFVWIEYGRAAVLERTQRLHPLLSRALAIKWYLLSLVPRQLGRGARLIKRWSKMQFRPMVTRS